MDIQLAFQPVKKQDFEKLDTTRKVVTRGYRDIETQVRQFLDAGIALDNARAQYEFNGDEEENFNIDSKDDYYEETRPTVDNLQSTKSRVEAAALGAAQEELSTESIADSESESVKSERTEDGVESVGKSDKSGNDSGSTEKK